MCIWTQEIFGVCTLNDGVGGIIQLKLLANTQKKDLFNQSKPTPWSEQKRCNSINK